MVFILAVYEKGRITTIIIRCEFISVDTPLIYLKKNEFQITRLLD